MTTPRTANRCPRCHTPAGFPCRTRSGNIAARLHIGRAIEVEALDTVAEVAAETGVDEDTLRAAGERIMRERAAALDALPTDDEPEESAEVAPVVELRNIGRGLAEVVRAGVAAGRVSYQSAHWWGYDLTGARRTGGFPIASDAAAALDAAAPGITPDAPAGATVVHCDNCSAPVDACVCAEPATVERYRAPSGNRDEDRFRAVHAACGWRSLGWHSNRTIEGRGLAERDAREHRCPEPAVDDDPREQPRPLEWSEVAGS